MGSHRFLGRIDIIMYRMVGNTMNQMEQLMNYSLEANNILKNKPRTVKLDEHIELNMADFFQSLARVQVNLRSGDYRNTLRDLMEADSIGQEIRNSLAPPPKRADLLDEPLRSIAIKLIDIIIAAVDASIDLVASHMFASGAHEHIRE